MGLKNDGFYMNLNKHVVDLTEVNTVGRIKSNEILKSGANYIWDTLRTKVVRGGWNDHNGYPLKSKFFEKGKLACSISIRRLIKMTGIPNQRMQSYIKMLKKYRWLETSTHHMARKQTAFTLGYWVEYTDTKGKKYYKETWYKDEVMEGTRLLDIPNKVITIEEETIKFKEDTMSYDDIYFGNTSTYFSAL
jgi:hypothetical protein